MISQRYIAPVTHRYIATVTAEYTTGCTAPVEKENSLLPCTQYALKLTLQSPTDNTRVTSMQFVTEIDHFNWRQVCPNTPRQFDQCIYLSLSAVKRLYSWRSTAQHHWDMQNASQHNSRLACMIH